MAAMQPEFAMPQTFTVGARSLFVTVTAWIAIVLSGVAASLAVLQAASVASLMPSLQAQALPPLTSLLATYSPWLLAAGIVLALATMACAIGLLLRLEWARRAFIGVLLLTLVAHVAGLWLQHELLQALIDSTLRRTALPGAVAEVVGGFVTATRAFAAALVLAACALLGWVIRRLMSPAVRQEFA
ncbi:hypothetical protein [Aquabacterium sp. J223]|uniref:hypothetical protein n=1 Tax=Aquabacterium sp. J223 TaxID=2898431 RepID=UPI0021AD5AC0|nr:hypothetical protein [Aquabacterium sp. J223]UUX94336.1 hypothetical protein LRS07_13515 [Aquabacterium sp. J223]